MIFEACTEEQRRMLLPKICDGFVDRRARRPPIRRRTGERKAVETRLSKTPGGLRDETAPSASSSTPKPPRTFFAPHARRKAKWCFSSSTPKVPGVTITPARRIFCLRRRSALSIMSPFRLWISLGSRRREAGRRWKPRWTSRWPILLRLSSRRHPGSPSTSTCEYTRTPRRLRTARSAVFQRVAGSLASIFRSILDMARLGDLRSDSGASTAAWDARARSSRSESDGQRRLLSWDRITPTWSGPGPGTDLQPSDDGATGVLRALTLYQYLGHAPDIIRN